MLKSRKVKIVGSAAVLLLFAFMAWVGTGVYGEYKRIHGFSAENQALLALAGIKDSDEPAVRFDKMRELVNAHSLHKIDENFRAFSGDMQSITNSLYLFAAGKSTTPPHLECAARAGVLANLAHIAGYKARIVALFRPGDGFKSHTLTEIYNPRTRRWEMHDPDYNVFYAFKGSPSQRVSARDALSGPLNNFEPCALSGLCQWDTLSPEGRDVSTIKPYFSLAIIQEHGKNTLIVNKSRYDIHRKWDMNGHQVSFCDLWPDLCGGDVLNYE